MLRRGESQLESSEAMNFASGRRMSKKGANQLQHCQWSNAPAVFAAIKHCIPLF